MSRSGLANVVGVSESAVPEDALLGRAATFTLPDEERSGAALLRAWAKHGLDVNDLPDARQPVHVFQSACASVKTRNRGPGANGHRVEVTADEIEDNGAGCSYQITLKVWDRAQRTIDHEKAMRVEFTKADSQIKFVPLDAYDARMAELERAIRAHFDANAKTVPGQKIRNAVRETLLKLGAQNLRRKAGGLYFVPKAWTPSKRPEPTKPMLDGLKGVLAELYGDRADFYVIPLANDEEMQAMVRKHFVINAKDRAEELTLKALNRVRAGKGARGVRQDLVDNMRAEQRKLLGAVHQFDELVALEKQDVEANLRDLDEALRKLEELAAE